MDKQPIETSNSILLVAAGTAENTEMGWNNERTSVGTDWGNAPVLVEGITAKISWTSTQPLKMLNPNGKGNLKKEVLSSKRRKNYTCTIGPQNKTLGFDQWG